MSRNPPIPVLTVEETIAAAARIAAEPRRQTTGASTQVILSMAVLLGQFHELAQLVANVERAWSDDGPSALDFSRAADVTDELREQLQQLGYVPTQLQEEPPHGEA